MAEHITTREIYEEIIDDPDGHLVPLRRRRDVEAGNSFDLDHISGDTNAAYFSYGPRYRALRGKGAYGFVFDPRLLIQKYNAYVSPDLGGDYEDILDQIAREIDKELPPLKEISPEELRDFASLFGIEDPGCLEAVRRGSTSRYHDLCRAISEEDPTVEGAEVGIDRFRRRVRDLQGAKRKYGRAAIEMLSVAPPDGTIEVCTPGPVPIREARAFVEQGEMHPRPERSNANDCDRQA